MFCVAHSFLPVDVVMSRVVRRLLCMRRLIIAHHSSLITHHKRHQLTNSMPIYYTNNPLQLTYGL